MELRLLHNGRMHINRILVVLALLPATGAAQRATFGIIGGAPAEPPLKEATSKLPFVVGPTVNLKLFSGLSLDTGFLYYRLGSRTDIFGAQSPEGGFLFGTEMFRGRAIELPFLARYSFLSERRSWQPFFSAGPAVRRTSLDFTGLSRVFSPNPITPAAGNPVARDNSVKWKVDPVVAAGVSVRAGRFHFEPQVRYSYWGAGKHSAIRQNQVHIMFGFRF